MSPLRAQLYSYPLRGMGTIAIFIALGPIISIIAASYLGHQWVGGSNLMIEIFDVVTKEASPNFRAAYSYYMPSVFISGVMCSLTPSRGEGLSLASAIKNTIVVSLLIEIILMLLTGLVVGKFNVDFIMRQLGYGLVQWIIVAWVCWLFATGFKLDKAVSSDE